MTNREWLMEQMQNMSDEELVDMLDRKNSVCIFIEPCPKKEDCSECILQWLKAEHKEMIKLTEAERVILENLPEEYKWIGRDEDDTLKIGTKKLKKADRGFWYCGRCHEFTVLEPFNHLFQFIKWEDTEPYNIEELLKGG